MASITSTLNSAHTMYLARRPMNMKKPVFMMELLMTPRLISIIDPKTGIQQNKANSSLESLSFQVNLLSL